MTLVRSLAFFPMLQAGKVFVSFQGKCLVHQVRLELP